MLPFKLILNTSKLGLIDNNLVTLFHPLPAPKLSLSPERYMVSLGEEKWRFRTKYFSVLLNFLYFNIIFLPVSDRKI